MTPTDTPSPRCAKMVLTSSLSGGSSSRRARATAAICPFDAFRSNYRGARRVVVVMRTFAALLLIGMIAALTAPALAQTNYPANPTAAGPVPPPLDALWPPANAGCGENGTTKSDIQPTVRLTSATLRLTPRGGVRIRLRGGQTAAMFVKLAQVGGKRVGGTERGSYNCTAPGNFIHQFAAAQRLWPQGRATPRPTRGEADLSDHQRVGRHEQARSVRRHQARVAPSASRQKEQSALRVAGVAQTAEPL